LMDQGRYAEARDKLRESLRYAEGLGTRGKLAECYEKLGATATAWSAWRDVAARARKSGEAARERFAAARAEALSGRLTHLTIVEPRPAIAGLVVELDGVALGPETLGTAIPVDPGPHELRAAAPGRQPGSTTVRIADGMNQTVAVPELTAPTLAVT